jgi:hypothetical protein
MPENQGKRIQYFTTDDTLFFKKKDYFLRVRDLKKNFSYEISFNLSGRIQKKEVKCFLVPIIVFKIMTCIIIVNFLPGFSANPFPYLHIGDDFSGNNSIFIKDDRGNILMYSLNNLNYGTNNTLFQIVQEFMSRNYEF